jgi:hypothetical protein
MEFIKQADDNISGLDGSVPEGIQHPVDHFAIGEQAAFQTEVRVFGSAWQFVFKPVLAAFFYILYIKFKVKTAYTLKAAVVVVAQTRELYLEMKTYRRIIAARHC